MMEPRQFVVDPSAANSANQKVYKDAFKAIVAAELGSKKVDTGSFKEDGEYTKFTRKGLLGTFTCSKCRHRWTSSQCIVVLGVRLHRPKNQGKKKKNNPVVQVRLGEEFGQQCKRKKCQKKVKERLRDVLEH